MVVILLGPPGVGKGTQGAMLTEELGWERIATGDLLRAARREGSELGRRAGKYMEAGELVPDDLIVALVEEHLGRLPPDQGVIFDGFPRTVPQARALDRALTQADRRVDGVILLEASHDVLVKRVAGRRSCPACGRVYNVHFDPPGVEGICDACGETLVHRDDDRPETVSRRLDVYEELTAPLVEYYEDSPARLLRIDGEGSLDEVRDEIARALSSHLGVEP